MDRSEASQMALVVKNLPADAGDMGSNPGSGRSPEEGNDSPLQCSCLGNPMEREAWWATVHGVSRRVRHDLGTKQQQYYHNLCLFFQYCCQVENIPVDRKSTL